MIAWSISAVSGPFTGVRVESERRCGIIIMTLLAIIMLIIIVMGRGFVNYVGAARCGTSKWLVHCAKLSLDSGQATGYREELPQIEYTTLLIYSVFTTTMVVAASEWEAFLTRSLFYHFSWFMATTTTTNSNKRQRGGQRVKVCIHLNWMNVHSHFIVDNTIYYGTMDVHAVRCFCGQRVQ